MQEAEKKNTTSRNLSINTKTVSQFFNTKGSQNFNINHSVSSKNSKSRGITFDNADMISIGSTDDNWIHMDFMKNKSIKE